MKEKILSGINDPQQLEKLYRSNKTPFKREFSNLYPELKGNALADFWHERLRYESDEVAWGTINDLLFVAIAVLIAGFLVKIPAILPVPEEFYYPRNAGFIVFPVLAAYFAWKNKLSLQTTGFISIAILVCVFYINSLPASTTSDTLLLACIHLPLLLWVLLGISYAGDELNNYKKRLDYLRFNGDLIVMSAVLGLAGVLMTGITIALFSLISLQIEEFYGEYVVAFGLPAVPIVGTYLTQTNPQLVNKVSPIVAKIFSPLVLVMLIIYLAAIVYSGKDPYNDREFLLLFNVLLIGVMALIFFSIAESSGKTRNSDVWVLFLLSLVTVIVNGIALSAIIFRITEFGITPNRLAVLGGNFLMLLNLLLITFRLFQSFRKKADVAEAEHSIALFLPVYTLWTVVVVFVFPLVFGFK
ncbi:DUF4153 domain-containing protein [Pontibacter sp. KCTC 32443]|uniref:DUF4153 domain-containing protein n=1 Tax=Pontibacter TaxID=323449 RepID=UPI00164E743D|nr:MULTISPECIES: DUF4153 domain-containing protein [Pontibacter]MBC5772881.1 DUF4153 domain-containing protein [Pontibacter sp. KCTC 32443]